MNNRITKRALFLSFVSMFLCFTMLIGTTYAWFTDTVKSGVNQIVAGNLDVELYNGLAADPATKVTDQTNNLFKEIALWEPGAAVYENFTVANHGTLALKYRFEVKISNVVGFGSFAEVLKVGVVDGGIADGTTREAAIKAVTTWMPFVDFFESGALQAGTSGNPTTDKYGVVIWWEPSDRDNDFNMNNTNAGKELKIDIAVNLYATQLESESDSFGTNYDKDAHLEGVGYAPAPAAGQSAVEIEIRGKDGGKDGSAVIPAEAIDPNATNVGAEISESPYKANITAAAGSETFAYEVKVIGLKDGNTVPVKMTLNLPAGKDPATVKLYHYDDEIACTYNPSTGLVTFESADFSPFTVEIDMDSIYEAPSTEGVDYPKATVTYAGEHVNTAIEWASYGQWSPTEGLDSNLEAAFVFECPVYTDEAGNVTDAELKKVVDAYSHWYCDFYVSLDKALGANQIFLGGNYGSFGWVGFHNGDITLAANEEIALLGSVTNNPWTYQDVENYVGEFICGVGDVDNALEGATFTVKLRLTNPENENEFYDVNTVTYTFGGNSVIDGTTIVTTADGIQDAINNGDTNISLGGDIDLGNGGITIP